MVNYPGWDDNTTSEEVFDYMREKHRLQFKLFRKSRRNPDPPLSWDPETRSIVARAVDNNVIDMILKMRYMSFFMEICTATPDGQVHCQRFPAPRTFFTGEIKIDSHWEVTKRNWRGDPYQATLYETSRASTGDLFWDVRINYEDWTLPGWRGPSEQAGFRCTISPHYGDGGFLALSSVINRGWR